MRALAAGRLAKIAHLDCRPAAKRTIMNSKVVTTTPAAASLKLLTLVQPRAAVVKICEVRRANTTEDWKSEIRY
jgi:hypothetical protein